MSDNGKKGNGAKTALDVLSEIHADLRVAHGRIDQIEGRLASVEARLDRIGAGVESTNARLDQTNLNVSQLAQVVRDGFERVDQGFAGVNVRIDRTNEILAASVKALESILGDHERRIQRLEGAG